MDVYPIMKGSGMQVAKWGNSLAVRLPALLVRQLGLKEGDDVDIQASEEGLVVARHHRPDEVLETLRQFRGRLSKPDRVSRDDANER